MKSHPEPARPSLRRRSILRAVTTASTMAWFGASLSLAPARADGSAGRSVTVYKNPSCGCCGEWVKHLEQYGFSVDVVSRSDVVPDKARFDVPRELYSCPTARVAGYTIEGHVPAADIERLLAERPPAAGLAVPGMPHGSPGMETGRVDRYAVIRFDADGGTGVFSRY